MARKKLSPGHPFSEWSRHIHAIMDEMLQRSFVEFRDAGPWRPATNVYERPEAYYVCVELAGVDKSELNVECKTPNHVVVRGCRKPPRPAQVNGPLSVLAMEVADGTFQAEIRLPEPIQVDAVDALYDNGYLWITLPRTRSE